MNLQRTLNVFGPMIGLSAVVIAPILVVNLLFSDNIVFDPVEFLNQYVDFAIGVVAVGIGFWLSSIYWADHIAYERRRRAKRYFAGHLRRLQGHITFCQSLLAKEFPENQIQNSQQRDSELVTQLRVPSIMREAMMLHYSSDETEEDEVINRVFSELFWPQIVPVTRRLESIQNIRGHTKEIEESLFDLKQAVAKGISFLEGKE